MAERDEPPFSKPLKPPKRRCPNSTLRKWISERAPWQDSFSATDKKVFDSVCARKPVEFPFAVPLVPPTTPCKQSVLDNWVEDKKIWVPYFEPEDYQTYQRTRNSKNSKRHYDGEFVDGPDAPATVAARQKYIDKSRVTKYFT